MTKKLKMQSERRKAGEFYSVVRDSKILRFAFCVLRFSHKENGMALLSATIIILLVLLTVGLSMVSSGLFEGSISETQRSSEDAFSAAQSGVKDAQMQIARDKNFSSAAYYLPSGCTLNGNSLCAKIVVEKDTASACSQTISAGQDCIIVTGTSGARTRKLQVILNVNAQNGKIGTSTTSEL